MVIPAYNSQETLGRTLQSVRGQTYRNLEIVVVDDGSRDRTPEIARHHADADPRVHLVQIENRGLPGARNVGIRESSGMFIAPVDADDIWHSEKIARQLDVVQSSDDIGFVYTLYRRIDASDTVLYSCGEEALTGSVFIRSILHNFVGNGSSLLIRRKALDEIGGYSMELPDRGLAEDWLLQILIARTWRVGCVPEYLTGYRQSPNSLSSDEERRSRGHFSVLDYLEAHVPEAPRDAVAASRAREWIRLLWLRLRKGDVDGALEAGGRAISLDPGLVWSAASAAIARRMAGLAGHPWPMFALAGRPFEELDVSAGRVLIDRGFLKRNARLAPRDLALFAAISSGAAVLVSDKRG